MTKKTIASLTAENEALNAKVVAQAKAIARMREELSMATAQKPLPLRPQPASAYREALAKARELAMKTHKTVKVGA